MSTVYKGDYRKGEIEIIEPQVVFQNKYLEIYDDHVRFPSGYEGTYVRINTSTNKSVGILPITKEGKMLVIKNFRHAMRGWGYEIPKGGMEPDEKTIEAASRELMEETGYTAEKFVYMGQYSNTPDVIAGLMECYIALDCYRIDSANYEKTEAIGGVEELDINGYLEGRFILDFQDAMTELLAWKYLNSKY